MYKVLIVDDERLVRIGIRSMIDWSDCGFEIVGEAGNGEAAYEKYLALKPQVLITDIKIPKKDGFWLIKKIREEDQAIRIIVLTCYDEFDYVREALKMQVSEYVLKAEMEDVEIEAIMSGIRSELDSEGTASLQQEEQGDEADRDDLVGMVLDKSKSFDGIISLLDRCHLVWENHRCCFLQMDFGSSLKNKQYGVEQIAANLGACRKVIENRLESLGICCIAKQFGKSITCLVMSRTLNQMRLLREIEGLRESIHQYFSLSFKSASSRIEETLEDLHNSPEWIFMAADLLFYFDEESHLTQEEEEKTETELMPKRSMLVERLCESIEKIEKDKIEQCLEEMGRSFCENRISSMKAKLEMVHILDDVRERLSIYMEDREFDTAGREKIILEAEDAKEAIEQMRSAFSEIVSFIMEFQIGNTETVVRRAVEYMEKSYRERISLEDVADHVGISKYYFSNLFKKHCKIGFSSYLNEIRVREAKKLLKNPNMNVNKIASEVGFNEQQYFSRIFKKYTGMTVTEYRNMDKAE